MKYSFHLTFSNLKPQPVEFIINTMLVYYKFFKKIYIEC